MSITFGSDPEFMLLGEDGQLKSAIGVVPGSKKERHNLKNNHQCYYDNVLAECSIDPASSKEEAAEHFRDCFSQYAEVVSPLKLVPQASAEYDPKECEHEEAKEFGCDPEFCAYSICVMTPPTCEGTFRSGGGHIHIGYDGGADIEQGDLTYDEWEEALMEIGYNRVKMARLCDLFIGIPSLLLDKDPTSKKRRQLYGGAGSHRGCEGYGVEYRSLSNFWLARPSLVELMFDLSEATVKIAIEENACDKIWEEEINPETLRQSINDCKVKNVKGFKPIIEKYIGSNLWKRIEQEAEIEFNNDLYGQWDIK